MESSGRTLVGCVGKGKLGIEERNAVLMQLLRQQKKQQVRGYAVLDQRLSAHRQRTPGVCWRLARGLQDVSVPVGECLEFRLLHLSRSWKKMEDRYFQITEIFQFRVSGGGVGKQTVSGCSAVCFATIELKKKMLNLMYFEELHKPRMTILKQP